MATLNGFPELALPSDADAKLAQESGRRLAPYLGKKRASLAVRVQADGSAEEVVPVPRSALRLLADILAEMGKGNTVQVVPIRAELTTQEAADLMNVSRPYLVKLLDEGAIPSRKVGTHRRVLFEDLMTYKRWNDAERLKALEELSAQAQELNMGY